MTRRQRWLPAVLFWTLFLVSIGLGERYRWIDTAWYAAAMVFLVVVSIFSVVQIFRNRDRAEGYVGYRGVPAWVVRLFGDDMSRPRPKNGK